jgi:hypothetical protein
MKLKTVAAAALLIASPVFAQQQKQDAAPPKPSKAEVEKLVKGIQGDKAKVKQYCDMVKLYNEAYDAGEKKDEKKADELAQKADEMGKQLGGDYERIIDGLSEVDPESDDGKALFATFEPLDKECPQG